MDRNPEGFGPGGLGNITDGSTEANKLFTLKSAS